MYYGSLAICFIIGMIEHRRTAPIITDMGMRDFYHAGRRVAQRITGVR